MRQSYRMSQEVTPSEQALSILENVVAFSRDKLLLMANSGSHNLNPYHNTLHELQNVYYSFSCFVNQTEANDGPGVQELVKAALFHDHNHSGGILRDDQNVARAMEFVGRELNEKDPVLRIINCTQFVEGKFPVGPENLAEKCIRDADLMTIYSREGFHLMKGLFEEMKRKPFRTFSEDDVREAVSGTENFLWAHDMFTDHGKRMKDEHLVGQLRKFEDYLWEQYKFVTYRRQEDEVIAT